LVIDLEETETRNDCTGEASRNLTDRQLSHSKVEWRSSSEADSPKQSEAARVAWRRRGRRGSPHCCKPLRSNVESIDARQRGHESRARKLRELRSRTPLKENNR
jgi:hypothetical protein